MYCKVHQMCGRCSWNFRSRRSSTVSIPCASFDMPSFARVNNGALGVRVYPSTSSIAKNNNIDDSTHNPFIESNGYATTVRAESINLQNVKNAADSNGDSNMSSSSTTYPNDTSPSSVSVIVHINSSKSSLFSSFNEPKYNTPTTDDSGTSGDLSQFLQHMAEEALNHPFDYHIFVNTAEDNAANVEEAKNLLPGNPSPLNSTFQRQGSPRSVRVQMAASNDVCATNPQPVLASTQMRSRPESGHSHVSWVTAFSRGNSLEWDNYQPYFETASVQRRNQSNNDSPQNRPIALNTHQHWC